MPSNQPRKLLEASSPDLILAVATTRQIKIMKRDNAVEWKGPLSAGAYLEREAVLRGRPLTLLGAQTAWILVDRNSPQEYLAGCETVRVCGVMSEDGLAPTDLTIYSIRAVFCPPQFRRRGYTGRLLEELSKKLSTVRVNPHSTGGVGDPLAPNETIACVLYSDIGPDYYARFGWVPCPATYISLTRPDWDCAGEAWPVGVQRLRTEDLHDRVIDDTSAVIKSLMQTSGKSYGTMAFAIAPTVEKFDWFHAGEEFLSHDIHNGSVPIVKGAMIMDQTIGVPLGWCVWAGMWKEKPVRINEKGWRDADNVLFILRMVLDAGYGAEFRAIAGTGQSDHEIEVCMMVRLLKAARLHAGTWNLTRVEIWNPDERMAEAARRIDPAFGEIRRQDPAGGNLPCLKWLRGGGCRDGPRSGDETIWMHNELYGWI